MLDDAVAGVVPDVHAEGEVRLGFHGQVRLDLYWPAGIYVVASRLPQMIGPTKFRRGWPWLLSAAIFTATSAFGADAENGQRLAERWCEACHVVTPTQRDAATDQAPPFATIAKMPGLDATKIALFLLAPHLKMPDMALSRSEAADLAAYIASLK